MTDDFVRHYELGVEAGRLRSGSGALEFARSCEILERHLPPAPADVLDVGGGPGAYTAWLSEKGHRVHLVDPVPLHVDQARTRAPKATAAVGDARALDRADRSADAVLLMGPLYHLTGREDRIRSIREAARVLRPGGVLFAAAVSRFASLLDGLREHHFDDPAFRPIVERDLAEGQHRNPDGRPQFFTTAFFHHPSELAAELRDGGFPEPRILAVEGPAWLLTSLAQDLEAPARRATLMDMLRKIEEEPTVLGVSAHFLAVARRT